LLEKAISHHRSAQEQLVPQEQLVVVPATIRTFSNAVETIEIQLTLE